MSKETSKGRKKARSSSSKNGGETEGEGILKCICKKKSEKGTMIQCEACTVWQHTQCLGMNDSELPSHYICNSCLALREDLPSDFAFISNKALKKEFEDDFALENTDDRTTSSPPKEKPKYRKFSVLEKQLLDKYFGRYATTNDLKEKDNILLGLAVLLHCAPFGIGCLFKFIAEEATNFNKDDDSSDDDDHDDPYKDWNLIKKNIYSSGISQVSSSPAFDTDMQEPVQLQVRKYGNDWGVMIQQSVDQKQFIAEYFGVWLSSNTACYEDTSPATRFMLAHPNSNICVDARRSGSIVRFLRRSCTPNVEVREVIGNDNTRRLGVFALEHLPPNVELTIAFDRPWKNYTCALKCACGSSLCPVMQWYDERSVAATKTLDIFRKKGTLQKLKSSVGRKQTTQEDSDVDDFEEEEPEKEEEGESDESEDTDEKEEKTPRGKKTNARKGKQTASATAALSSTTNGTGSRRNSTLEPPQPRNAASTSAGLSREERKLQQIMRSFEKMENRERLATTAEKKKKVGKTEKEKEKEPEKEKEKSKAGNAKRKTAETATSSASSTPSNANRKRTRVDSESEEEDTTKARRVSRKDNKNASPARDQVKSLATSTTPRNDLKRRLSTSEDSLKSPRAASPQPISSVSSPPLSSSGQAIPTKKAWLQDFEEKKSEACFPLKKKMLSNFYASAASSTESTSSSPTVSSPKAQPPSSPQLIKAEKSASPVTPRSPQVPSAGDVKAKSSPSPQRRHSGLESIKREDAPSFRRSADSIKSEAPSGGAGRPDRRPLETIALPTFRRDPSLDANRNDSSASNPSSSTTPASTSTPITTPTPIPTTTPAPVSTTSLTNIPPISNSAYYPPTPAPPPPSNSAFPNSPYGPAGPSSNSSFENHSSSSSFSSYSSRSSFAPRSPPVSAAPRGPSGPSSSYGSPTKQQNGGGAYHHHHRGSSGLLQTPPYPSSSGSSSSSRSFSVPHHSAPPPPPPPSDYRFRPGGSSGGSGGGSGGSGGGGGSRYGGSAPPPPPPPYGGGGSHWSNSRTNGGSGGNPVRTQIDRYAPRRDYHFA